jgi:uncharacterized protein YecT (DUF1311 family)
LGNVVKPGIRGTLAAAALLAGTLAAASARAGEPQFSPALDTCLDKAKGVTADMVDCIGAEIAVQDKRLNDAYKAAIAKLTPRRQKELQGVQRLWLQFRDANCKFAYDPDGGTMAHVESTGCIMSMTAERAQELEAIVDR